MKLYKKSTAKPYTFLIIDATLASDSPSRFRKNLLKRIQKLIREIVDKFRDENLQYDINREASKIPALSPRKIDEYEYVTVKEILPFNQRQKTKEPKFGYSPLRKGFEKQTEKQFGAIKSLEISNKKD